MKSPFLLSVPLTHRGRYSYCQPRPFVTGLRALNLIERWKSPAGPASEHSSEIEQPYFHPCGAVNLPTAPLSREAVNHLLSDTCFPSPKVTGLFGVRAVWWFGGCYWLVIRIRKL